MSKAIQLVRNGTGVQTQTGWLLTWVSSQKLLGYHVLEAIVIEAQEMTVFHEDTLWLGDLKAAVPCDPQVLVKSPYPGVAWPGAGAC